jgi:hypothetical protein
MITPLDLKMHLADLQRRTVSGRRPRATAIGFAALALLALAIL